MWKCPKCETINNTEACTVCGEKRPAEATMPQRPAVYPSQEEPYAYHREEIRRSYREDAPAEREHREKKNNGLIITVVICVTFIVALLLALGAYIFMQGDDEQDVKVSPTNEAVLEYSSAPSDDAEENGIIDETEWEEEGVPVPEKTPAPERTPEPTPETTSKPVSTPTPKPDYTSVREGYKDRAAEIDRYASIYLEGAQSQAELNQESGVVYQKWDDLLNEVYQYLKQILPSSQFEALKKDEVAWIKKKEKAMNEESEAWGTGSGRPLAVNSVGIQYTKERCYELIDMIR